VFGTGFPDGVQDDNKLLGSLSSTTVDILVRNSSPVLSVSSSRSERSTVREQARALHSGRLYVINLEKRPFFSHSVQMN
jgi:hypothetical protein